MVQLLQEAETSHFSVTIVLRPSNKIIMESTDRRSDCCLQEQNSSFTSDTYKAGWGKLTTSVLPPSQNVYPI